MRLETKYFLEKELNIKIQSYFPLSGSDISKALLCNTNKGKLFIKLNSSPNAMEMFEKESMGLQIINETHTIKTPEVYGTFNELEDAILVMEYVEAKTPSPGDMKNLGIGLRKLHKSGSEYFGLNHDNFIGTLHQSNKVCETWEEFYTKRRLTPQFMIAQEKKYLNEKETPDESRILECVHDICGDVKPGLVHGDLWSGNYIISEGGEPYLIDPAIYYGHGEVDIAMSNLFGGFDTSFYQSYFSNSSEYNNYKKKEELYQLYYLLVHLNMFGMSYYNSVKRVLKSIF